MKKIILQFTTIAIILLLGACSNDEIFEKNDNKPALGTVRTLSITATMPGDKSDGPATRVGLEQQLDNSIVLKWEQTDQLQLAFVQGETKIKSIATMMSISDDGKKAQFDMLIPDEITDDLFDLYGVYGGGGLDETDPTLAKLPENAGDAGSLTAIQTRKDVMLHFASKDISIANPKISAVFKHIGSLFSITFADAITQDMLDQIGTNNIAEARLVGVNNVGNVNWAYNAGTAVGNSFDLVAGAFQNTEASGNYISLSIANSDLTIGEPLTAWGWYPPLADTNWPELALELRSTNDELVTTSANRKTARATPTAAGQSYYFYAAWNGTQLNFTDESYTPDLGPTGYHVMPMGTLSSMLNDTQKDTITTMIITGEINKADFEVMKRQIPNLKYIDLSAVTCEGNKIPDKAFGEFKNGNTTISTIILPLSITSIGKNAFGYCKGLTGSLTIPAEVTSIDESAFSSCYGFTGSLKIPEGVEIIHSSAFSGCKGLDGSLSLPTSLKSIYPGAFAGCSGFTGSLNIPEGVTLIGYNAFTGCSGFNGSLSLPSSLKSIGLQAFNDCSGFTGSLNIPEGVETIGSNAFSECSGFDGSLTLPSSLKSTGTQVFFKCSFTGPLIIPAGLKKIETNLFWECSGFTSLVITDGVTSIGTAAFLRCSGLTGSLNIPKSVTTIGNNAFNGCSGFTGTLNISESVTSIESSVFNGCSGFTGTLNIPESVTTIGNSAFANCTSLGALNIPEGLTSMEAHAFSGCFGFTGKVVFPESLAKLENNAFQYCPNIAAFRFPHTTPIPYYPNMLNSGKNVEVPSSAAATYKATEGWNKHPILGYYPIGGDLPGM